MTVKRPVSASLAKAFFYIVLLSILSTGSALLTLTSSLRDAEAINIAGSLRMQSYRLGYDLQSRSPQINAHRQLFQHALNSPVLQNLNAWYVPQAVKTRYARLHANWLEMNSRLQDGDIAWYQTNINNYVDQIDLFVLALQHYAERKVMLVVAISLAGGIGIFTLVFFTLRRIRQQVVRPLNQLVTASQRIEHGQFAPLPLDTSLPNELGLLAKTFSQMSSELHKLYRSLEASVEEKTHDLHEAHRRLEVLYQCSQALNTSQIDVHCFRHILQIVREHDAAWYLELTVGDNWRISEGAQSIMADFSRALNDAYRQLRELLTTFRLTLQQADLPSALHEMLEDLQSQTPAKLTLDCRLPTLALDAQMQVHLLQIVREAVLNAIKHANASEIAVSCVTAPDGDHTVYIRDNGIGIGEPHEPAGHYGLNIMRERAERLGGTLNFSQPSGGGTLVSISFRSSNKEESQLT
ncbi:nitrate/nitrite sensor histidine kinase [Salmonella enterica]|nr:nitrate/nitrite sensor histidine kinase [Salmonella enterica]